MRVLVLGGGGREHTLVWKISQSPRVEKVFCIPGNGGISQIAECNSLPLNDFDALSDYVKAKHIDFTVVGPEVPLVEGIVDYFEKENLPIFGPNKAAAQLEGSKIFSKRLMKKYGIPTAAFEEFENKIAAMEYLDSLDEGPIVVKADGLAAGKGAVVCKDIDSAKEAVSMMMTDLIFKEAGSKVVIEEFMTGEEVSIFAITDGKDIITLSPAQDFKRALDGDQGKNTGGMGSYAPSVYLDGVLYEQCLKDILKPTLKALQSEGIIYKGVIYAGLMLTPQGPKVIEFNCRFGDPETQVVLPLLKSDLMDIFLASVEGKIGELKPEFHDGSAVCIVLASGGYPDYYNTGKTIEGLTQIDSDALVFHAGTTVKDGGNLVTSGGRVMSIGALESSLTKAVQKSYNLIKNISFEGMHYRRDIAKRALSKS